MTRGRGVGGVASLQNYTKPLQYKATLERMDFMKSVFKNMSDNCRKLMCNVCKVLGVSSLIT